MKSFTFRLEAVLHLRAREEDRAHDAWAQSLHERARIESKIAQARETIDACHAALRTAREGVSNRQHQLVLLNILQQHHTLRDHLAAELRAAEREVAVRQAAMLEARRRREALTRLRAKQRSAHRTAAAKEEEAMIGDLIAARYAPDRTEAVA